MQITELRPPMNGGTLFFGQAISTRGRRYFFYAPHRGKCTVFRESSLAPECWMQITPGTPSALQVAARRAVRKAVRS